MGTSGGHHIRSIVLPLFALPVIFSLDFLLLMLRLIVLSGFFTPALDGSQPPHMNCVFCFSSWLQQFLLFSLGSWLLSLLFSFHTGDAVYAFLQWSPLNSLLLFIVFLVIVLFLLRQVAPNHNSSFAKVEFFLSQLFPYFAACCCFGI